MVGSKIWILTVQTPLEDKKNCGWVWTSLLSLKKIEHDFKRHSVVVTNPHCQWSVPVHLLTMPILTNPITTDNIRGNTGHCWRQYDTDIQHWCEARSNIEFNMNFCDCHRSWWLFDVCRRWSGENSEQRRKRFCVVRFHFSKQFPQQFLQPVFNFTPDLSAGEFKVRRSWKFWIHNSFSAPALLRNWISHYQ